MSKKNFIKKLNGQILMMQNDLMSKLSTIDLPKKQVDELGFNRYQSEDQDDALINLISRSKNIVKMLQKQTKGFSKQIEAAKIQKQKQSTKRKQENEGTFLTGLGIAKENIHQSASKKQIPVSQEYIIEGQESNDPDLMLKELIERNKKDDLQQLRKMIKETGTSLEGCSKKLNKSKKSILQMADRYTSEMSFGTYHFLHNYREFQVKKLDDLNQY